MISREPALDGLRALCVAGVLASGFHWLLPFGWSGVQVFFVLSGTLITNILLRSRAGADTPASFVGRFYFRRTLRIFPLYFAYLLALQLVDFVSGAINNWSVVRWYALGYVLNFGILTGAIEPYDAYGHLWTLSVEEQFYLLWPVLVWILPLPWFTRVTWSLVVLGPLVRYGIALWSAHDVNQVYVSTFSHLDAFATGALLAIHGHHAVRTPRRAAIAMLSVTAVAGLLIVASVPGLALRTLGYPEGLPHGYAYLWGYSAINLCAVFVIAAALKGELSWLGHPVLAYVGRISYGVYLFQRPLKGLYLEWMEPSVNRLLPSTALQIAVGYCVCALAAVAIAAVSYRWFEAPLLAWRDRVADLRSRPC